MTRLYFHVQQLARNCGVNPWILLTLWLALYPWLLLVAFLSLPLNIKSAITVAIWSAPFVYCFCATLMQLMRGSYSFKIDVKSLSLEHAEVRKVSRLFKEFWADDLWGEYLRCKYCASLGSFYDKVGAYSLKDAQKLNLFVGAPCPKCAGILSEYWSDESVMEYLQALQKKPDFRGHIAYVNGNLAGWVFSWGGNGIWKVDTIAIVSAFRKPPFRVPLLMVFMREMLLAYVRGYRNSTFRTHVNAKHVQALAKVFSYCPGELDTEHDLERVFWHAKLSLCQLFISFSKLTLLAFVEKFFYKKSKRLQLA